MSNLISQRLAFGDFQTSDELAARICHLLAVRGIQPRSILEPSCGVGSLLLAALHEFQCVESAVGIEINEQYSAATNERLLRDGFDHKSSITTSDFFGMDVPEIAAGLPQPVLIIGNPPWATNARLSRLGSDNLPQKRNFKNLRGFDALTGRSNFDISEWFILRLVDAFARQQTTLALLCKTSVARQALTHLWRSDAPISAASLHLIDAKREFGAATDACLLLLSLDDSAKRCVSCCVFADLDTTVRKSSFGLVGDRLVSDIQIFDKWSPLLSSERTIWRSGIKHDCAPVMELTAIEGGFRNGLGEEFELESLFVFPQIKATDLFHGRIEGGNKAVIVTQRRIGEETSLIRHLAPLTWKYLIAHSELLDARKSSIYRGKPRFSVFGIGAYSFAEWKVSISALHKDIRFSIVGPRCDKATMLDDTCYFLPIENESTAGIVQRLLSSEPAREFLRSQVFWDSKRPITTEILGSLDLASLATLLGEPVPASHDWLNKKMRRPVSQVELFAR